MNTHFRRQLIDLFILLSVALASALCPLLAVSSEAGDVDNDQQIGFVWEPPINAETTVMYYRVYLSVNGGVFRRIDTTTDTFYVVPGDSGYCYRLCVAGVNAHDEGGVLSLSPITLERVHDLATDHADVLVVHQLLIDLHLPVREEDHHHLSCCRSWAS